MPQPAQVALPQDSQFFLKHILLRSTFLRRGGGTAEKQQGNSSQAIHQGKSTEAPQPGKVEVGGEAREFKVKLSIKEVIIFCFNDGNLRGPPSRQSMTLSDVEFRAVIFD